MKFKHLLLLLPVVFASCETKTETETQTTTIVETKPVENKATETPGHEEDLAQTPFMTLKSADGGTVEVQYLEPEENGKQFINLKIDGQTLKMGKVGEDAKGAVFGDSDKYTVIVMNGGGKLEIATSKGKTIYE